MVTAVDAFILGEEGGGGISVVLVSLEWTRTDLTLNTGVESADQAARVLVKAAVEGESGELYGGWLMRRGHWGSWGGRIEGAKVLCFGFRLYQEEKTTHQIDYMKVSYHLLASYSSKHEFKSVVLGNSHSDDNGS
ncbi:hypothetical protein BJY04DRAFT_212681 [Aspergillus karnatakaensis]|uniref:uncharacterized protein n=1 Tax=Aspergillus karnatakaensis TaxID=1810916 RepID=UPI003CCE0B41